MRISTPSNNRELLLRAAGGDEASFSTLFYDHHRRLVAFVSRMTGSQEVAKDIVQEVFIKIWEKREALADVKQFDAYIYVLARNRTLNHLRKIASERLKNRQSETEFPNTASYPETDDGTDYYALLDEAVDHLPPQQQTAYILSRRKRQTCQEIARQMDLSGETVKKYLKLANRSVTSYLRTNTEK